MFISQGSAEPDGEIVELRVHGVGGAPPSQLLNDPDPVLVSGSVLAGFWRPERDPGWLTKLPWLKAPLPKTTPVAENRDDKASAEPPPRDRQRYPVEAFSWGGLTSGDWTRSLWILLAPFALSNAAGWMHEPNCDSEEAGSDERAKAPFQKQMATWFSLTLTVMLVWIFVYLAVDLIAWRCGWLSGECRAGHSWLDAIVSWAGQPFLWFGPSGGRMLVVGSLVPLLVLVGVWLAGRASFRDYEQFSIAGVDELKAQEHSEVGLRNPHFWQSDRPVRRLQRLHLAIGLTAAQLALASALQEVAGTPRVPNATTTIMQVLLIVGGLTVVAVFVIAARSATFVRDLTRHPSRDLPPRIALAAGSLLLLVTVLLAFGAPHVLPADESYDECVLSCPTEAGDGLKPIESLIELAYILSGVQVLLVLAMLGKARGRRLRWWLELATPVAFAVFVVLPVASRRDWFEGAWVEAGWWRELVGNLDRLAGTLDRLVGSGAFVAAPLILLVHIGLRRRFGFSRSFLGMGPSAVSALAAFIWGSFWAGSGALVADAFDGDGPTVVLHHPRWFPWVATSFAALLIAGLVAFLVLSRLTKDQDDQRLVVDVYKKKDHLKYPDDAVPIADEPRVHEVAAAYRWKRIVARADRALAGIEGVTLGLATFQITFYLITERTVTGILLVVSNALVVLLPVVMLLGVRYAYRSEKGRRGIGSAWDVLTFFPRTFHPFAPPCYADRAVPQLSFRITRLAGNSKQGPQQSSGVVLRAHSQGTVLAMAAITHALGSVDSWDKSRLRLLTFGSPLATLYGRIFPAYFGRMIPWLAEQLGGDPELPRWEHFYADTDPLGTRLFDDPKPTNPRTDPSLGVRETGPIADPPHWIAIDGEETPPMGGHSTYWRHPLVDLKVARLSADLGDHRDLREWVDQFA